MRSGSDDRNGECLRDALDHVDDAVDLPRGALDLHMAAMADDDHLAPGFRVTLAFEMDAAHERAGGIEHGKPALRRLALHRARDAVGAEDRDGAVGNLRQVLDEDRALAPEFLHHAAVMDDLVPHIDGLAGPLQRILDGADGALDAGAEAARGGDEDGERQGIVDHAASSVFKGRARGTARAAARGMAQDGCRMLAGHDGALDGGGQGSRSSPPPGRGSPKAAAGGWGSGSAAWRIVARFSFTTRVSRLPLGLRIETEQAQSRRDLAPDLRRHFGTRSGRSPHRRRRR